MLNDQERKQQALNKLVDGCLGKDVRYRQVKWSEPSRCVNFRVQTTVELAEVEALRVLLGSTEVYMEPTDEETLEITYEHVRVFPWEM